MKLIFNPYLTETDLASQVEMKGSEAWERESVASGAVDDLPPDQLIEIMAAARERRDYSFGDVRLFQSDGDLRCVRVGSVPSEFVECAGQAEAEKILWARQIRFQVQKPKRWVYFPEGDYQTPGHVLDYVGTYYEIPERAVKLECAFMRLDGCGIIAGLVG